MAKVNRYYEQQQAPYISQYADYKLPYEAIQNSVVQRQGRFDSNQQQLANAGIKYGQIAARSQDSEGKAAKIDEYLSDVHDTIDKKYGGDFSLGAGDIYDKTASFTADPMWDNMRSSLQDEGIYKETKAQAKAAGDTFYDMKDNTGERSIFGEDGTLQESKYDYRVVNPKEKRAFLEEFFNNKELDKTSFSLDALNKAASLSTNDFVAYYETNKRSFDADYLGDALDTYRGHAQYEIYLDQAKAKGLNSKDAATEADGIAMKELLSASKEYKVNQTTGRPLTNPAAVAARKKQGEDEEGANNFALVNTGITDFVPNADGSAGYPEKMDEVKEAMRVDPKTATTPQDFLDKSDMKWNANFADEAIEYDISTGNKPTDIRYQVSDSVYQAMAPEAIENIITTSGESFIPELFASQSPEIQEFNTELFNEILRVTQDPDVDPSGKNSMSSIWEDIKGSAKIVILSILRPGEAKEAGVERSKILKMLENICNWKFRFRSS